MSDLEKKGEVKLEITTLDFNTDFSSTALYGNGNCCIKLSDFKW